MSDFVSKALALAEAKESAYPSALVDRPLDTEFDLGNLLAWSENEISVEKLTTQTNNNEDREAYLKELARDNAQLLFNGIWSLPTERVEEAVVAVLPTPSYILPREKPMPKGKPMTKWEKYSKEKGIEKKKKTRLVWDDVVKDWVPRFGYKKAQAEEVKNWMMPYKGSGPEADRDPFEKALEDKRERTAKNELQRLRNIAKAKKVNLPGVGIAPIVSGSRGNTGISQSSELLKAADLAKKSTASLGKFQEKLPSALEKKVKPQGNKRKFEPLVQDANKEKSKNLEILEKISSKKGKVDVNKGVGRQIQAEERARQDEKAAGPGTNKGKSGRRGGGGGKKGGGAGGKRSAGKRNRKTGLKNKR